MSFSSDKKVILFACEFPQMMQTIVFESPIEEKRLISCGCTGFESAGINTG